MNAALTLWGARGMAALCFAALLGLLLLALADLARAPLAVHIHGAEDAASQARLQSIVEAHLEAAVPGADLAQLAARLQAENWVRSAVVRWRWPRQLEVRVREQTPVARWGEAGLLDTAGQVMQRPAGAAPGLARLQGPPGSGERVKAHYQLATDMLARLDLGISALVLDDAGRWELTLDNGVLVRTGAEAFGPRLRRVVQVWEQALAAEAHRVAVVDARYRSGVAVAWRDAPADGEDNGAAGSPRLAGR